MEDREKTYQRLLSFATGFKDRFALLLVKSSHFDVQREWQERLSNDLKKENIQIVHIRGEEMPGELISITSFIRTRVPTSGRWLLSLSHFDYHMMPTFSHDLQDKDLLSEEYRPEPAPPVFVQRLNVERDAIVKVFPVPIIFWASAAAIKQLAEYAPDFYDFRQFIIDLPQPDELRMFPNIPRASFIKTPKPEPQAKETFRQLAVEREELQYRHRTVEESRRFIDILSDLGASQYAEGHAKSGLSLIQTALNEAKHLNLTEEQARLQAQIAYFCHNLKQWEKAFLYQEETIALYRNLAKKDQIIYLPGLVNALNRKAILLAEMGKPIASQKIFEEALKTSRTLFEKEYEIRAPLLAEVLNNFALLLSELGQLEKAEIYYKEAVKLYRNLPNKRYRILLALVLNNLGNLMATMNRLDAALPLHQEALHLRRLYFANNPERHRADLSQSLYNLSLLLGEMGNFQEAKHLFEEAVQTMLNLPDHGSELLGCSDSQEQLHGFRIELGEIEMLLGYHLALQDAVVIVREDVPMVKRLIAYIVLKEKAALKLSELRNYLRKKLPEYLIPSKFVILESIPLLPNGKVNRKVLPEPDGRIQSLEEDIFTLPRTDIEKALCGIWSELLDIRPISVNDDFFGLGGESLRFIMAISKIHKIFHIDLSPAMAFENPTVAGLAKIIERELKATEIRQWPIAAKK